MGAVGFPQLRGIIFCVLLASSSYFGVLLIILPTTPLLYFVPVWFRFYLDEWLAAWTMYPIVLLENLCGTRFTMTGDLLRRQDRAVLLLNHRTCLDWMYTWRVIGLSHSLGLFKISLKEILRYMPGAGWAMQYNVFMFLSRDWTQDQNHISRVIQYYRRSGRSYKLLLFPEGTDFDARGKKKSDAWADARGLPRYEYCMHPRTKGFVEVVKEMRAGNYLDAVYDLTISYGDEKIPHGETSFLRGHLPEHIHFGVKRYIISDLPQDEVELASWCDNLWREKEETLKRIYSRPQEHAPLSKSRAVIFNDFLAVIFFTCLVMFSFYHIRLFLPYLLAGHLGLWLVSRYTNGIDRVLVESL